jgi:hypothetical protein
VLGYPSPSDLKTRRAGVYSFVQTSPAPVMSPKTRVDKKSARHQNAETGRLEFRPSCCERTLTEMRSLRRFSILLLFLLAFGLVCSEIPETLNLCDDTSNDFVGSPPGLRLGAVTITHQVLVSRRGSSVADLAFRTLAMISSVEPVVPSGSELLRLLSIQRK